MRFACLLVHLATSDKVGLAIEDETSNAVKRNDQQHTLQLPISIIFRIHLG